jgi:hypothetical protein
MARTIRKNVRWDDTRERIALVTIDDRVPRGYTGWYRAHLAEGRRRRDDEALAAALAEA